MTVSAIATSQSCPKQLYVVENSKLHQKQTTGSHFQQQQASGTTQEHDAVKNEPPSC